MLRGVLAVSPYNGQADIGVTANVTAVFDFQADGSTINSSTFELRDPSGVLVPANVSFDAPSRTATLNPTGVLLDTSNYYTVSLVAGASGIKEVGSGLPLDADVSWSFTTEQPVFDDPVVLSGLNQPTVVRFAPSSDGRVFVAEKGGIIKVFQGLNDPNGPDVFADLRAKVHNYWDRGLLGMALDPNFPASPYVYVHYTYNAPLDGSPFPAWSTIDGTNDNGPGTGGGGPPVSSRLSRLTIGPGNSWDGNELVLINDWPSQYPSHAVGTVEFGPDGALYVSAGDGASFGFPDYGQNDGLLGSDALNDPVGEGGALRSLDLLTSPQDPNIDPVTLDGTIIRVDPATGAALPTNPLYDAYGGNDDPNAERVVAFGLRNPFRFTVRDNGELWIGDVGWRVWEEINVVRNPLAPQLSNFGWPAYEGAGKLAGYDNENLPLIENYYAAVAADPSLHATPFYAYDHSQRVDPTAAEPTGSSAISGIAFYSGENYPAAFDGALFFSDYNRGRVWVMFRGLDGEPDPSTVKTVIGPAEDPVGLFAGPDGDLYYVELNPSSATGGTVRRIEFLADNRPPRAIVSADVVSGPAPLTVHFDGSASNDPDGTITYSWDLNADGQFGDSTSPQPSFTYDAVGSYDVQLRVTDDGGFSNMTSILIQVGAIPTVVIDNPLPTNLFQVGQVINFAGRAYEDDVIDEAQRLPDTALEWTFTFYQAETTPDDFNIRNQQVFSGVGSGQYIIPDWEYPVYLEVDLTATDSSGLQSSQVFEVNPQVVTLSVDTNPPGLALNVNGRPQTSPLSQTVVVNSLNTISVPSTQVFGSTTYEFDSWSDGGAASHSVVVGAQNESYTANFAPVGTSTVIYRVNAGGSQIAGVPVWGADTQGSPSPFINAGSQWAGGSTAIDLSDPSIPVGTPQSIFQSERWDPAGGAEMQWNFPVTPGNYQVRLYFAETYGPTQVVGGRVFDVLVEGVVRLDNYDVFAKVGGNKGVMESLIVTSDGNLDIDFGHVTENPSIKAIEIIQLGSIGQPPIAVDDDLVNTLEGAPVTFNVLDGSETTGGTPDSDPDGSLNPLTVTVTGVGVSGGTLVNRFDGTFDYTPAPGFIGIDSFTYTVDDIGGVRSNEATVTITVGAAPGGTVVYRVNAGGGQVAGAPVWGTDTQSSPSLYVNTGSQWASVSTSISLSDPSLPVGTPQSIFQSERWDPAGGTEMQWNFPVTPGNYEVRLYFAETYGPTQTVGGRVFDVLIEGVVRLDNYDAFARVGGNKGVMESLLVTSDGNLDIDFVHVVENPSIKAIEIVRAGSISQPPIAVDDDLVSTLEGTPVTFNVLDGSQTTGGTPDSDPDGSIAPATVTVTGAGVSNGTLVNHLDGTFDYTPSADFFGIDMFTYTVDDNTGTRSNTATVTITVGPLNDDPVVDQGIDNQTAVPGVAFSFTVPSDAFDDVDGDTLLLGASGLPGWLAFTSSTGEFSGTPIASDIGTTTITVTADDLNGGTPASTTFDVTVSVNTPPVAVDDDLVGTLEGTPVTFNVLDGSETTGGTPDSDIDGSLVPATVTVTGTGVANGTLVNRFDGTFDYTPVLGFTGIDSFTYTVDDIGGARSNEATVTITVDAVPQATVIYRVNAGGSQIAGVPVWGADTQGSPSPFINAGSQWAGGSAAIDLSDPSIPVGTPQSIFQSERWDPASGAEMQWNFPVTPGNYQVRLYFAETYGPTQVVGGRVFDVLVEGVVRLDSYDVFAKVGGNKGVMESLIVTSDGNLDIDFGHVTENPSIRAIEIIQLGSIGQPPIAVDDDLVNTLEGAPVTFNVLDGSETTGGAPDSDPDGSLNPLTVTVTGVGVSGGTLVNRFDGTFDYTPSPGFIGIDSFTYTVDDIGGVRSNEAMVTITVGAAPGGTVVYRVNAGGGQAAGAPAWGTDTQSSPSPYVNTGSQWASVSTSISLSDPSLPAGTPQSIFQSERWDPAGGTEMQWNFPVTPGNYEVRLYFAETYGPTQTVGGRVFDVLIEGVVRLDNYDAFARVGGNKGVMESLLVTSDGNLDIDFVHVVENPSIKAIEIVRAGSVSQSLDANQDNTVSAVDALVIINHLGRISTPDGEYSSGIAANHHLDVNGDRRVSAADALMIVNYLATVDVVSSGELTSATIQGPAPVVNAPNELSSVRDDALDDLLMLLAEDVTRQLT